MLVLDDGWFGKRNNDRTSLGDWFVNREKLGDLPDLVRKINQAGLKFGLWFEPEMVSEESELFRAHPDWAIQIPGRRRTLGRNQMVLDMSREEVVEEVFRMISSILHSANIEYVKWDMNRNLTEVYSPALPADQQGETAHRYVLGVYRLHEMLLREFPNLLIEGCSGGGGRFDAGILYYCPQIWCSDDTDAIERLAIQGGTSLFYPCSSMGAHVSVCPNHITGRTTPFETRGYVAFCGTGGYELDLTKLNEEERDFVRSQVEQHHQYHDLVTEGTFYRLSDVFNGEERLSAWGLVSKDRRKAALIAVLRRMNVHMPALCVRLQGLDPKLRYRIQVLDKNREYKLYGDTLMNAGFVLQDL